MPKHGMAAGPMTPVVDALHKQNEIDVFAIAAYVGTLRAGEKPIDAGRRADRGAPARVGPPRCARGADRNSARAPRCSQRAARNAIAATAPPCRWRSRPRSRRRSPDSVVQVIRNGIRPPTGALGRSMPAFGPQMSEAEITALVKFLRARFSTQAPWKM